MKKSIITALALVMAAATALPFAACNGGGGNVYGEDVDPERTQVYLGNYYGGLGDAWLKELKGQFEAAHPDVQILIRNDKTPYLRDELIVNIASREENMFFVDKAYYYDLVSENKLAEITDIVTTPLTEYGEDRSIADKLDEINVNYYSDNEITDGKWYALPTYLAHRGIVYDVDLFENKGFYLGKGSTDERVVWTKGLQPGSKAAGPDGTEGTYDDGLPATYTQFLKLLEKIRSENCIPFIWTGKYSEYPIATATAFWVDYEGYDKFRMNYTFKGTLDDGTEITEKNAYLLQTQEGKRFALQFVKDLLDNSFNYASSSVTTINDHLGAQKEYVWSYPDSGTKNGQPIAMIFEGDWWENEANNSGAFSAMSDKYGSSWAYGERRFAFLPIPKAEGSSQGETVLSCSGDGAFFINATCKGKQLEYAKEFLRFCHTEASLHVFNLYTGVCAPYDYTLSEEELGRLTYFSRSAYELYHNPATKICYNLSESMLRVNNHEWFDNESWEWQTQVDGAAETNPFKAFTGGSLTVDKYFAGLLAYQQSNWSRFGL